MTRDDILDVAAQVIRQKGFHGASMADIATAVNLKKASLYHHVSSKQEILLALLDRALEMLFEHISSATGKSIPPDEKLRQMIHSYLQVMTENGDLAVVLLMEHRSLSPDLRSRHVPNRDKFELLWRDVVVEGIADGVFSDIDPVMAKRALFGVMNWTITWFQPDGELSIEQITEQYANLLFNGLLK